MKRHKAKAHQHNIKRTSIFMNIVLFTTSRFTGIHYKAVHIIGVTILVQDWSTGRRKHNDTDGLNSISSYGDEFIHMCNFLTINFDKKIHESFFVQKQFLIMKNKWNLKYKNIFFKMAESRICFLFKKERFSIANLACYITSLPKAIYERSNVIFFCASSYLW